MTIRKKTKEELTSQVKGFLQYEEGKRKIDEEKSKELFDVLLKKELVVSSKGQTRGQLMGVLNSEEFGGLYEDYCKWLEKGNKVRKNIIEKILPKEYMFLSNENFLKNYFMDNELDDKNIENYRIKIEKNIGIFKKYYEDSLLKEFIKIIIKYVPEYLEKLLGTLNEIGINNPKDLIRLKELILDKYKTFAKENKELAENTLERIKRILEEKCGIKFNSKYDSSIIGAEIHDSGSTGRGTDIPTKDVDLDFTLILDEKDYERVNEIGKIIHEEIGTQKDDDHGVVEGGNQIKSKINNIGKSDRRPNGVPLDLLILKKSQVIDYSSSDAMKEKLKYIAKNPNNGVEDLDRVRTNVIIMKKLLKAKCCYKKPEGGISGIGVENRITQCHGSFIEALESFEQVAYGGIYEPSRQPLPLEKFQECYPIYDAGENYKHSGNDNFVYKLKENGYIGILEIARVLRLKGTKGIRRLIKEYEKQKAEFI